jgi:cyclin T
MKDGMTIEQESIQRRKTCRFIEEAGRILKLPRVVTATAMVFFHRFYAKHSFGEHDRFDVAYACLVLAAKTEESPKKLNTVITECHKLKVQAMRAGRVSSTTTSTQQQQVAPPQSSSSSTDVLDMKSEEFIKLKERVLLLERVILHTIGFELSIEHPYTALVDLIRQIVLLKSQVEFIDPKETTGLSTSEITKKLNTRLVQLYVTKVPTFVWIIYNF